MSPSARPFVPPSGYPRVKLVGSFEELVETPFGGGVNALCWPRDLCGDFEEVVKHLSIDEDIGSLDEKTLRSLPLSAAGRAAVDILLEDVERLRTRGLEPVLDCIHRYPRDEDGDIVPTDVYSFHADSATVPTDTFLCSYTESASEGLRNDEAQRRVDVPEVRAALLKQFGGQDNDEFLQYLREACYDLHYLALPGARPFGFGLGNLWRIAVEYPGSPVPPCVHRAPETIPGRPPRLLLIS